MLRVLVRKKKGEEQREGGEKGGKNKGEKKGRNSK